MANHSGSVAVGLDFNDKFVKAVEIRQTAAGPTLTKIAVQAVPPRLGSEDVSAVLAKAIATLLADNHFETKEVYIAFSGSQAQTRRISLPLMPENELKAAVRWEAKNFVTFPIELAIVGYYPIARSENTKASKKELLAVALESVAYQKRLLTLEQAGIKPAGLTIAALAFQELFPFLPQIEKNALIAFLDLGETTSSLSLYKNNVLQFTRELSLPSQELALTIAAAQREIISSFDFFRENYFEEKVSRIFLTGDRPELPEISAALGPALGLEIERLEPTKNMNVDPQINAALIEKSAPGLALAIGLALGRCEQLNLLKGKETKPAGKLEMLHWLDRVQIPNTAILALLFTLIAGLIGFNFYLNTSIESAKKELNVQSLRLNQLIKYRDRKLAFQDIIGKEIDVKQLLQQINSQLGRGMTLAMLVFDNEQKEVELGGECDNPLQVTGFLKKAEESPYFARAELVSIRRVGTGTSFQVKLSIR